jgi:hypothetical protein
VLFVFAFIIAVRRPVVVINDKYFSAVYGEKREKAKAAESTLKVFRRVRIFRIDDFENNEKIAAAIAERYKNPFCVIFPYRYTQAAVIYAESNEQTRAIILEERNLARPVTGKALYIPSSWETDYYRAAYIAAMLAQEPAFFQANRNTLDKKEKTILTLTMESPPNAATEAFESGLAAGGWEGKNTIQSSIGSLQWDSIGAAILISSAGSFIQGEQEIPAVVFSAARPYLFPHYVKVVIDDSVWPLLPGIVKQAGRQPRLPAETEESGAFTGVPLPARIKRSGFQKFPLSLIFRIFWRLKILI